MFKGVHIFGIIKTHIIITFIINTAETQLLSLKKKEIVLMAKKEKKISAHNGKQGNATRQELFIALKYLLEKCPDDKHTSKTIELEQYADENFNVLLDRRRVNDIFNNLVDLTTNNPSVIPYVVKQVEGKSRYYIKKTLFTNKEIESIARAIQNDQSISVSKADKYVNDFLDVACNKQDKERISKKLERTELRKLRVSDLEVEIKEGFEYLRDMQMRFYFRLKKPAKRADCTDLETYHKLGDKRGEKVAGIVFDVYTNKKQSDVCIYLPDFRQAVMAHTDDVEIDKTLDPVAQINTVSFYVGEKFTLKEWVDKYYKGETGTKYYIRFGFPPGQDNTILKKYARSFEAWFGEKLKYEIKDKTIKMELPNGETEDVVISEVFATTHRNYESFRKWFWDGENHPYETVVVFFPAAFNDRLLGPITRRFQATINTFGFNSDHGKAEREAFEKRIADIKKKKEAIKVTSKKAN